LCNRILSYKAYPLLPQNLSYFFEQRTSPFTVNLPYDLANAYDTLSLRPSIQMVSSTGRYLVGYLLSVTLMKAQLTSLFSDRWRIIKEGRTAVG
jgi:hypothetical protein